MYPHISHTHMYSTPIHPHTYKYVQYTHNVYHKEYTYTHISHTHMNTYTYVHTTHIALTCNVCCEPCSIDIGLPWWSDITNIQIPLFLSLIAIDPFPAPDNTKSPLIKNNIINIEIYSTENNASQTICREPHSKHWRAVRCQL